MPNTPTSIATATTAPAPTTTPWQFHWACTNLPLSDIAHTFESVRRSPFVSDAVVQLALADKFWAWAELLGKPYGSAVSALYARKPYDYGRTDISRFPGNAPDRYMIPPRLMTAFRDEPTRMIVDLKNADGPKAMGRAISYHLTGLGMEATLIDNLIHPTVYRGWIPWSASLELLEEALSRHRPEHVYLNVAGHPSDFTEQEIIDTGKFCDGIVWETFYHLNVTKSPDAIKDHIARVNTALSQGVDMVACPTAGFTAEQVARGIALFFPEFNAGDDPNRGKVRIAAEHGFIPWPAWEQQLLAYGPAGALTWSNTGVTREFPTTKRRITLTYSTGQFSLS